MPNKHLSFFRVEAAYNSVAFIKQPQPQNACIFSPFWEILLIMKKNMKNSLNSFGKNFIKCGILGWCLEIVFTSLHSLQRRDFRLKGTTSLYMFPIYGAAVFLTPIFRTMKGKPALIRGITYAGFIFTGEYLSGSLLEKKTLCPWDYNRSKWNIKGIVRLDYLPFWILAGLLFEKVLENPSAKRITKTQAQSPSHTP